MKQLGNLALVCAKRPDTQLVIIGQYVRLYINNRDLVWSTQWDDDETIEQMIRELNFGRYKQGGD